MLNLTPPVTRLLALFKCLFPAKDDTAANFTDYLAQNDLDFAAQQITDQERTLHDYLTHEIGLNLWSDIKGEYKIRMTYGDKALEEYLDIDLRRPMQQQIELLLACCEDYYRESGNYFADAGG